MGQTSPFAQRSQGNLLCVDRASAALRASRGDISALAILCKGASQAHVNEEVVARWRMSMKRLDTFPRAASCSSGTSMLDLRVGSALLTCLVRRTWDVAVLALLAGNPSAFGRKTRHLAQRPGPTGSQQKRISQ